ncbi:MAG TPA: DUF2892 domain-containing protein [Bacillota bacterium]|nr:DUF2892 domain-containing protein [Bacillota bacterium]HPT86864.1 DUF2892 domain-containing protein [Bacillota bacterium]
MRDIGQNIGPLDRATRIILGMLLLAIRYFFRIEGLVGDGLVFLGGVWIWEGLLGYCLMYGLMGWSTRRAFRRRVS